jgi:hypothetical protein
LARSHGDVPAGETIAQDAGTDHRCEKQGSPDELGGETTRKRF